MEDGEERVDGAKAEQHSRVDDTVGGAVTQRSIQNSSGKPPVEKNKKEREEGQESEFRKSCLQKE